MKCIILAIGLLIFTVAYGQRDTTIQDNYWSPNVLGLRTGIGFQKTIFIELGLSYHKAGGDIVSPEGRCAYSSIEYIPDILPTKTNHIIGFKGGYELAMQLGVFGIEVKYLTDFKKREDVVFTPKIGLGMSTMAGIMYGYHIPVKSAFDEIGYHQFSLVVNIDKLLTGGK